ncbi:MAG TPA: hypothetical protein VFN66_08295 [Burkholderiales bacterium]|nr:hypothetical protein [Burkholderiales bacterium]
MALKIETFSNAKGGNSFFKALGHPLTAVKAAELYARLMAGGPVAIYDPLGMASGLHEFYALDDIDIAGIFVQRIEDMGKTLLGHPVSAVTRLPESKAGILLVAAFDADRLVQQIRHLVPAGMEVISLDGLRLPDAMLTNTKYYLDTLNFATNFGFFRDTDGQHTRIVTCDYWSGLGAKTPPRIWCRLFDQSGAVLAQWEDQIVTPGASVIIDSKVIRERFGLGEFTASLFIHILGVARHDIVKYALDLYGDDETVLSCTHDANAWPSDLFAGLPAPDVDETVIMWIQNSHPVAIPANAIGINLMGSGEVRYVPTAIAPFASYPLDVGALFPEARWPQQMEVQAGRYFVRPRYEIHVKNGRSRIAHVNVERNDLVADDGIPGLAALMGKSYILPAPIMPVEQWRSIIQPTPMSTAQHDLPVAAIFYDASGAEVARHAFGCLLRRASVALDINAILAQQNASLPSGTGHVELVYDFSAGGRADGWLHGLFRYTQRASGHIADSSFGAHIYNTVLTYRNEPQSYASAPPGLSTRLFLRLGDAPLDTFCHLIYPASTPWHAQSDTRFILYDRTGAEIAQAPVRIPCSGSLHWRYSEGFDAATRNRAGEGAYIIIRDLTCRLFGYHGTLNGDIAFSMDHMFGF